jgi:hypothetical protein
LSRVDSCLIVLDSIAMIGLAPLSGRWKGEHDHPDPSLAAPILSDNGSLRAMSSRCQVEGKNSTMPVLDTQLTDLYPVDSQTGVRL